MLFIAKSMGCNRFIFTLLIKQGRRSAFKTSPILLLRPISTTSFSCLLGAIRLHLYCFRLLLADILDIFFYIILSPQKRNQFTICFPSFQPKWVRVAGNSENSNILPSAAFPTWWSCHTRKSLFSLVLGPRKEYHWVRTIYTSSYARLAVRQCVVISLPRV